MGRITLGLPHTGKQINLIFGDRLDLPAGIAHMPLWDAAGSCVRKGKAGGSVVPYGWVAALAKFPSALATLAITSSHPLT